MSHHALTLLRATAALVLLISAPGEAGTGACRHGEGTGTAEKCMEDDIALLQSQAVPRPRIGTLQAATGAESQESSMVKPPHQDEFWPVGVFRTALITAGSGSSEVAGVFGSRWYPLQTGALLVIMLMGLLGAQRMYPSNNVIGAVSLGALYICVSACMIETNKWLMLPGHFPYPLTLTTNHMLTSLVLANILRCVCPSAFPALQKIDVTPWFCVKFLPVGAAFALSIVCGNAAYKYLSVSFLQIMKQCNVVVIYTFSVLCGLEALRRCSVALLFGTLCGTMLAVHGELHFEIAGFLLQVVSTLSEATKVIIQGILMSGTYKLDPMTMVLFMAPACLLSNLVPFLVMEGPRIAEIWAQFVVVLPMILLNAVLAFVLNLVVAQCIKQLSPVGYLLCGIVKDVCIIVTSAWFLGESLSTLQVVGFSIALSGVASYSMYKQHLDCFQDDLLLHGFARVSKRFFGEPLKEERQTGAISPKATASKT